MKYNIHNFQDVFVLLKLNSLTFISVKQKLNCPEGRLCLPDGTEIDDDEGLTAARDLSSVPVFTFVPVGKDFTTSKLLP